MSKLTIVACVFFGLALLGGLAFNLIGSTVDADGILREPFALIPLSYLSALIGLILMTIAVVQRSLRR